MARSFFQLLVMTSTSPGPAISIVVAMPTKSPSSTTPGTARMAAESFGALWMTPKAQS